MGVMVTMFTTLISVFLAFSNYPKISTAEAALKMCELFSYSVLVWLTAGVWSFSWFHKHFYTDLCQDYHEHEKCVKYIKFQCLSSFCCFSQLHRRRRKREKETNEMKQRKKLEPA